MRRDVSHAPTRARRAEPSRLARVRHDQRLATAPTSKVSEALTAERQGAR
jgi:hypothetical protein